MAVRPMVLPAAKTGPSARKREEDDRPRTRPSAPVGEPAKGHSGVMIGLAISGLVLVLLLCGGGAILGVSFWLYGTPAGKGPAMVNAPGPDPFNAAPQPMAAEEPAPPAGDPIAPIPLRALKDLKNATVFIKLEAGQLSASGSGFRHQGPQVIQFHWCHLVLPPAQRLRVRA